LPSGVGFTPPLTVPPKAFFRRFRVARKKAKKRYRVEFCIELENSDIRLGQVESWVRYHCGDKGRLRRDNPLCGKTLDPIYGTLHIEPV
jgi:hypothetical protein